MSAAGQLHDIADDIDLRCQVGHFGPGNSLMRARMAVHVEQLRSIANEVAATAPTTARAPASGNIVSRARTWIWSTFGRCCWGGFKGGGTVEASPAGQAFDQHAYAQAHASALIKFMDAAKGGV